MNKTWRTRAMAAAGAVLVGAAGVQGVASALSQPADVTTSAVVTTATAVDAQVAKDLQFTREEERMARDLYAALAAKYDDARPFSMITRAEQRHFDATGTLMTRYGVSDPSAGKAAGTYAYPELQKLYDGWLAQGSKSIDDAYDVGIALEKRDIADLKKLSAATKDADAKALYTRLTTASEQHLAAFEAAAKGELPAEGAGPMGGRGMMGDGQGMMGRGGGMGQGFGQGTDGAGPGAGPGAGFRNGDCPMVDGDDA